jgi:subtilisin family serine protease
MRFELDAPPFHGKTGKGIRVAVIDSGIHAAHPHVAGVAGGAAITVDAERGIIVTEGGFLDRLGHGTAVAAAIREKAPDVELLGVKVFDSQLTTSIATLIAAIQYSADCDARLINLSLGTASAERGPFLANAIAYARERGSIVVSASESADAKWFPGSLPDVAAVQAGSACERDQIDITVSRKTLSFAASPFPRPIPGVPPERNLSGISFAVANTTGFLARLAEDGRFTNTDELTALLRAAIESRKGDRPKRGAKS